MRHAAARRRGGNARRRRGRAGGRQRRIATLTQSEPANALHLRGVREEGRGNVRACAMPVRAAGMKLFTIVRRKAKRPRRPNALPRKRTEAARLAAEAEAEAIARMVRKKKRRASRPLRLPRSIVLGAASGFVWMRNAECTTRRRSWSRTLPAAYRRRRRIRAVFVSNRFSSIRADPAIASVRTPSASARSRSCGSSPKCASSMRGCGRSAYTAKFTAWRRGAGDRRRQRTRRSRPRGRSALLDTASGIHRSCYWIPPTLKAMPPRVLRAPDAYERVR